MTTKKTKSGPQDLHHHHIYGLKYLFVSVFFLLTACMLTAFSNKNTLSDNANDFIDAFQYLSYALAASSMMTWVVIEAVITIRHFFFIAAPSQYPKHKKSH